jgi:PAS domain S-box-containing protein
MSAAEPAHQTDAIGRLHIASSEVSRAILRGHSRKELLNDVTRILVESGGFAMAFIAWHDLESRQLLPAARFGDNAGYADHIRIYSDDRLEGQGPSGTAFRTGVPYICNDFAHDEHTLPWREASRVSGWLASAAFPILVKGEPKGLLSVYSREEGFFGGREITLLTNVAGDIAFGLEHIDAERLRRQAEEALAASNRHLKLAMDAAGIGTFDWDIVTGRIVWDGHHEQIFGYGPGDFNGTYAGFERRIHPDDLPGMSRNVETAGRTRNMFVQEFRVVWPDGSIHWVVSRGEFSYNEAGVPIRLFGATLDISKRKRAEMASHESEERLRLATNVSNVGIFDYDHRADSLYWSPEQRRIYGVGPDEIVNLDLSLSRIHPDDRDRSMAAIRSAHDPAGDGVFEVENRLQLPDGTVRWAFTKAQTYFEGEGSARRPVRTIGAAVDVTGRKRAEAELVAAKAALEAANAGLEQRVLERSRELAQSEERMRMAAEGAGLGAYSIYFESGEPYWSAEFKKLHGFDPHEPLKMDATSIPTSVHPDDHAAFQARLAQTNDPRGDGLLRTEYRVIYGDGSVHWLAVYARTRFEGEGEARRRLSRAGVVIDITDRKQSEQALARAHEQLALAMESTGLGLWDWKVQTGEMAMNDRWAAMLGYSSAELEQAIDVWRRLCHPEDLAKAELEIEQQFAGATPFYQRELRMRHKDGHWVLVLSCGKVVERDSEGRPLRMIGTHLDISERKQREEALREAKEVLALTIEAAQLGTWDWHAETGEITINERWAEMLGYSVEELAPVTALFRPSFTHPDDLPKDNALVRSLMDGLSDSFEDETRMRHKDGHWVHVLTRGRATGHAADGRPTRITGINLDISSLNEAEERLRTFSQVVEQSPVIVIITTPERAIEYVNSAFSERTGYSLAEVLGETPSFLKSNLHPREFYDQFDETLRCGGSWHGELCDRAKDGTLFWLSAVISPIRNVRGVVIHFVQISQDITQQKQAREELRLAKEAAEAANRSKSAFLANMSHEIRTPLNAILGYAQLLRRDPALPARTADQIEIINKSGEHLMNLISDILEMSKIEVGRVSVAPVVFDLRSMIADVAEMFRARAAERSIEFSLAQNEALPRVVRADEGKIRQVLVNLLSNAVKFTERGRVEMRCDARQAAQGSHLLSVEVEDTGAGISEQEMGRLFHHFEQTASGKKLQMGTGLGLAISLEFARLMGGDITVSSQEGRGSIFRFQVPVAEAIEQVPVRPQSSRRVRGLQPGQPPLRVLIADDYDANREWVKSLLLLIGAEVREAANGEEAFSVWQEWQPPLVLMDLRMPVLDGLEATRRIKAQPDGDKTVVLALTAAVFQEDRIAAVQAGAAGLLGKPLKEEVLFEKIHEHLGVDFIYEDETEPQAQAAMSTGPARRAAVAALPGELRAALSEAILDGDSERIDSLVCEAATHSQTAAAYMRKLAEQYDYETLSDLVKPGESK